MARLMRLAPCAAALLAACSITPTVAPGTPGVCTSVTCFAAVDVQDCATGAISVTPDTLVVTMSGVAVAYGLVLTYWLLKQPAGTERMR